MLKHKWDLRVNKQARLSGNSLVWSFVWGKDHSMLPLDLKTWNTVHKSYVPLVDFIFFFSEVWQLACFFCMEWCDGELFLHISGCVWMCWIDSLAALRSLTSMYCCMVRGQREVRSSCSFNCWTYFILDSFPPASSVCVCVFLALISNSFTLFLFFFSLLLFYFIHNLSLYGTLQLSLNVKMEHN